MRAAVRARPSEPSPDVEPGGGPPQWMLDLEAAHDQLRHGARLLENGAQPVIDLRPAARALERSLAALFDAYDHRGDRLACARRSLDELDTVVSELRPAAPLDAAIGFALEYFETARGALLRALDRLAPLVPRPPAPAPDLRASIDVPKLHALDRPSLVPTLQVPLPAPPAPAFEPLARLDPQTFEELAHAFDALKERQEARRRAREEARAAARSKAAAQPAEEPPPGFSPDPLPAVTPVAFAQARARECFEMVSMLGVQRAPLLGDPWRSSLVLERRMLAALDALVGMGPVALSFLEPLVRDAPAKDPARVFGIAMVLGCVAGRDALAAAERAYLAMDLGDPEVFRCFASALKVVPHPLLPIPLRTFLGDADPTHRALAIDVLASRELATVEELARAAADEPEVAAIALPPFALTGHPAVRECIEAALSKDHAGLRRAAWLALAYAAHPHAALLVSRDLTGELAGPAAEFLAVVGDGKDALRLLELCTAEPTRPLINALGWAGAPEAVPLLMRLLQHDDPTFALAAAYALERITGAQLFETAVIPQEDIMVPEPPEPDVGELAGPAPLARVLSDPRDLPGTGAPERVEQPTIDRARWRAWYDPRADHFKAGARYRRGYAYTPAISLNELDRWPGVPGERRMLQNELIIRTGGFVRFDVNDFVRVQEESIAAWGPVAARAGSLPGSWVRPMRLAR